jgi:putative Mg2+ transporter-C (MgtC) family protein
MISSTDMVIRLAVAASLGSVIGIERQRHEWTAGLRTHMLVCVGSALAMLVSAYGFQDVLGQKAVVLDPSRVAAQVISGIGFLGAGTIMFLRQEVVRGLTTAAGLWTVAGIGLAVGGGLYIPAVAATAIAWIILAAIRPLETRYLGKGRFNGIRMTVERKQVSLVAIEDVLTEKQLKYNQINIASAFEEDTDEIKISLQKQSSKKTGLMSVVEDLRKIKGVREVELMING